MQTANKLFKYDQIYLNKTLDQYANEIYNIMSSKHGWNSKKFLIGMYGYDALIMSIGYAFKYCPDKLNIYCLAEFIHQGWSVNYIYWRDNNPWLKSKLYKKPHNDLGDYRRNKLALTKFDDLPIKEKKSNIIIAKYILKHFTPVTKLYTTNSFFQDDQDD